MAFSILLLCKGYRVCESAERRQTCKLRWLSFKVARMSTQCINVVFIGHWWSSEYFR